MKEYVDLVQHVLYHGRRKENRTGIPTLGVFGYSYSVNLQQGFPLLTSKKVQTKSMLAELFWQISGEEHIRNLQKETSIWNNWADEEGRVESSYGRFWRRFPVPQQGLDGEKWTEKYVTTEENGEKVFDQLAYIVNGIGEVKKNPSSSLGRRLVMSAWHPGNAAESTLPPCIPTFAFNVEEDTLNCHVLQRSADVAIGLPFDLASYATLTHILAKENGMHAGVLHHSITDLHIYTNHVEKLEEQIQRDLRPLPSIRIADKFMGDLTPSDITYENYHPHPPIQYSIAV